MKKIKIDEKFIRDRLNDFEGGCKLTDFIIRCLDFVEDGVYYICGKVKSLVKTMDDVQILEYRIYSKIDNPRDTLGSIQQFICYRRYFKE